MIRRVTALLLGAAAVLAVAAPSSAATRECFLLTSCTSVVGPWTVIPAVDSPIVPSGAALQCPDTAGGDLQLPVGSDDERSGGAAPPPDVTRYMSGPGIGLINGANALFFAINRSATAASFRPRIGCVPQPGPASAAGQEEGGARVRTRDVAIGPSRTVVHKHRCTRGETLVRGLASVQFHRERAPSARELRDVGITHRKRGRRITARVRTGESVAEGERVTLHLLAVCAR